MRLLQAVSFCLLSALFFAVPQVRADASVVSIDVAAKKATSSVDSLDPKGLNVQGDQAGILIRSNIMTAQKFVLKTSGLKDLSYDVYVDQELKHKKTAKELEAGIELSIVGRTADPAKIRCLESALPDINKANSKLSKAADAEAKRISYTLSQAAGWASVAKNREQRRRSVAVIIAPSDKTLRRTSFTGQEEEAKVAEGVDRACSLLQQARDRMFHVIKNQLLRNEAVVAMTPVTLNATLVINEGKPQLEAVVLNNCDLPVSGAISVVLPNGWKNEAKDLTIKSLASGQSRKVSFDLIRKDKGAAVPDKLPVAANLSVAQDRYKAEFMLTANAQVADK